MSAASHLEHQTDFAPERAPEILRSIPELPGVFALCGARPEDQPYLTRTANLRRRLARLLAPPEAVDAEGRPVLSKRLNLRERVAHIEWSVTGSEFESMLVLYRATSAQFGAEVARKRLKLRTPFFLRMTMEHLHPRLYVINRLSARGLAQSYGPFASRAAAERYVEGVLDLFQLRRCYEDLAVSPEHPGCVYGEMKRCMAPCNLTASPEQYTAEARRVEQFLTTRGESLLAEVAAAREKASEEMEFEQAAALHTKYERVKAAAHLADPLVRPATQLRAVLTLPAAKIEGGQPEEAALFLLERGCLTGPARLSTLGVRAVKEQTSVGSSLFAQPLMLAPVPLGEPEVPGAVTLSPEQRAEKVVTDLEAEASTGPTDLATLSDHLSLLRRWYYRPEKQRVGELFLPATDGKWPIRQILRAAARAALGDPKKLAHADDAGAAMAQMPEGAEFKLLHAGRPDVERAVPVVKRKRRGAVTPASLVE